MSANNVLEVEIDAPKNSNLRFEPAGRLVRGRFDLHRVKDASVGRLLQKFPQPIPGQRLALNLDTGEASLIEPLHDAEHAKTRETIQKRGSSIAPASESFGKVSTATWVFWLRRAVQDGVAKITRGKFPDKIEGKVQKSFYSPEIRSDTARLASALETQNAISMVGLSDAKRREVDSLLKGE